MRLHKTFVPVNKIVFDAAKKHGVTIYKYANVGNHLHILLKISRVNRWAGFIRELTGRIALLVRQRISLRDKNFWLYRPYTRIVQSWKTAFRSARRYIYLNQLEAEGFISRKQSKTYKDLRAILQHDG